MRRVRTQKTGVCRRIGALAFCLAVAVPAAAGPSPISIGEVTAKTQSGEYSAPLREALRDGLGRAELGRVSERWVLSASLLTLDAESAGQSVRATAVVSLSLRRERDQTLHALLKGRATAEEAGTLASARTSALEAAVSSALRRLPEALR